MLLARSLGFSVFVLTAMLVAPQLVEARDSPAESGPRFENLRWTSASGSHQFSLRGRFVFDSATYAGDQGILEDGSEVRRSRVTASAKLGKQWRARTSWELSGGQPQWRNAWVGYYGFRHTRLRLGQQGEPFGLGQPSFMERALPSVFAPGYALGASASSYGRRWSMTGGVFGGTLASDRGEGRAAGARATFTPLQGGRSLLHVGFGVNLREPEDGTMRFRSRPESHVTNERIVSTGRILGIEKRLLQGLELAWVRGRYSLQGEYMKSRLEREAGREDLSFSGWYAQGGWVLTGETRPYRRSSGTFRGIRPESSSAVELAVRYSELDLDDGPVTGGQGRIWTAGVNWYYARILRVMVNYSVVHGSGLSLEDDPSALQLRLEVRVAP